MFHNLKNCGLFLVLVALVSCATGNRKAHQELKSDIKKGDIPAAIKLVKSDKFYPEKRSELLKFLELGTLQQIKGDYYQSLKTFDRAKELSDQLFTVSISKKVAAAVSSGNEDNYYGEIYERSLIRFYQALNHYMLYQKGIYEERTESVKVNKDNKVIVHNEVIKEKALTSSEKKMHFSAARAILLEWDSLLSSYHSAMSGETTYKHDLSSRLFGAFIHEQIGTSSDRQIAIKLYEDARKVLFQNYNLYPAFNNKFKEFAKDYAKLPNLPRKVVEEKYVDKTRYAKEVLAYIDDKIHSLSVKKKHNVTFVIQQGYVTEKRARKIDFPIPVAALPNIGGIVGFASQLLHAASGTLPTISFELPEVGEKKLSQSIELVIKDQNNKVVQSVNSVVINPISDIAYQTMDNKIISTYSKIGARLVGKHVAAIAAAYAASKKAGNLVASLMYAGANKAIAASEVADLRFWSTLPHSLRMAQTDLKPGQYSLFLKIKNGKEILTKKYKDFEIIDKRQTLINLNVF